MSCTNCSEVFSVDESLNGNTVECPYCSAQLLAVKRTITKTRTAKAAVGQGSSGTSSGAGSVLRIILMAIGGAIILFAALGAFGDYMIWGVLGGVLLLILAAIAK
jgi:DNA-directed RNA polymerase subunit RPC12/RpoP